MIFAIESFMDYCDNMIITNENLSTIDNENTLYVLSMKNHRIGTKVKSQDFFPTIKKAIFGFTKQQCESCEITQNVINYTGYAKWSKMQLYLIGVNPKSFAIKEVTPTSIIDLAKDYSITINHCIANPDKLTLYKKYPLVLNDIISRCRRFHFITYDKPEDKLKLFQFLYGDNSKLPIIYYDTRDEKIINPILNFLRKELSDYHLDAKNGIIIAKI